MAAAIRRLLGLTRTTAAAAAAASTCEVHILDAAEETDKTPVTLGSPF